MLGITVRIVLRIHLSAFLLFLLIILIISKGNVISDNNGMIITNFKDNVTSLYGPLSIIGRNVVLHQLEDDLGLQNNTGSKTIGNSGI